MLSNNICKTFFGDISDNVNLKFIKYCTKPFIENHIRFSKKPNMALSSDCTLSYPNILKVAYVICKQRIMHDT